MINKNKNVIKIYIKFIKKFVKKVITSFIVYNVALKNIYNFSLK